MKFLPFFVLILSCASRADYVFMKETENSKTIQWVKGVEASSTQTLNDVDRKEWALYPDISANGEEMIFVEGPGATDLHLTYKNLKKNVTQRFYPVHKGMTLHPKFSKNSRYVFYSGARADGKNTIYFFDRAELVQRQGSRSTEFTLDEVQTLDASEESYFPKPSSDGSFVVYQRNSAGKKEIILFDRVEKEKLVIAEGMSPALSFDERLIAFTSKKSGNWNIYVYNRGTKDIKEITTESFDEMAPTFQADNTLVYASNKSGHFRLYKQDGTYLSDEMISDKAWDAYSPQFSGEVDHQQAEKAPYIGNARSSFGTVTHQGKIYMAGGHQGAEHTYPPESFSDEFVVYDIEKNEWTTLAPRPAKAHGYQIAAFGKYVYAFGGFAYSADHKPKWKSLDRIDRYDIEKNQWQEIGKLGAPRSSNVAVVIDNKVILAAGWNSTPKKESDYEGTFLDTVEIFDLESEKLTVAPYKLPLPLRRALTGIEINGEVVMVGGLGVGSSHFELLQNVTSFNSVTGESKELTPLPFATFAPAAEVLKGELYVFGGMFKTGEMNYEYVAHIYGMNLKNKTWRHTGRYLKETKGFSQVFKLDDKTLGVLGGHRYFEGFDSPVKTLETFK